MFHDHANVVSYVTINRKSQEKFRVSVLQKICFRHFIDFYDKKWKNRVILSCHDQVTLDIQPQC